MRTLLFVVLGISMCAPAHAVLVEFDLDSTTQIRANAPGGSFDGSSLLNADNFEMANEIRSLLKNDAIIGAGASQIPAGVTIDSAVLTLYLENGSSEVHNVHQISKSWSAATVNWNNFNNGGVAGTDYVAAPGGTFTPGAVSGLLDIDVKSIVQEWSNGSDNQGFLLLASGGDGSSYRSDAHSGIGTPKLTVSYSTAAIPEPSSFALFGLVACGFGLKRWKNRKTQKQFP